MPHDGGDVIHQQALPIVWRPTLRDTLRDTRAGFDDAVPAMLEQSLRQILDGTARPRPIVPGPLRTAPRPPRTSTYSSSGLAKPARTSPPVTQRAGSTS